MNPAAQRDQFRLWLAAFAVSLAVNFIALVALGLWMVHSIVRVVPFATEAPPPGEVVTILPVEAEPAEAALAVETAAEEAPAGEKPFVRTSPDQESAPPERASFMGERSTRAASDAPPVADAPDLPSQQGREPDYPGQIETTESVYQDGDLSHNTPATPDMAEAEPAPPAPPDDVVEEVQAEALAEPLLEPAPAEARERLAEGPMPVDRPVKAEEREEQPKPAPERQSAEERRQEEREIAEQAPKPKSPQSPGFSGNQQKTRLQGSISRRGRSALDVDESLLGRYHAALSRAVEREWQLNCMRNRDYIVPGMLRVRFVLDADGKVRSVGFVEEFGVGSIQKGFTLNSIRDADIPAMPAELKKQLDGEPLELIYNFIF